MRQKPEKSTNDHLRITQQYHERGGMAYDFGLKLRVRVFPRASADEPGDWRVEARTSDAPGVPVVTGWGKTKADALQDTGRAWIANAPECGLPPIDWEIVTQALSAVRAV
jgi:hypothetical protein